MSKRLMTRSKIVYAILKVGIDFENRVEAREREHFDIPLIRIDQFQRAFQT